MKCFLEVYDERYRDRLAFIDVICEELKESHGITFVSDPSKCDVFITQQVSYAPNLDSCLSQKRDVVIFEVNDSASIKNDELRKAIKNQQVKGFFKITNFRNRENHNKHTSGDARFHANFINEYEELCETKEQNVTFTDQELRKIHCALPAFINFRFDNIRNANGLSNKDRKVDVNFAGTTDYTRNKNYVNLPEEDPKLNLPKLISAHRLRAINEIAKTTQKLNLTSIIVDHKPMSQPEYWNTLYNSKLCVSPWGFGAYNWRDYESIYLGALLIKPNTDFLESYCDLYKSGINYVACNHNFSNLQEIITDCLENFDSYTRIRENAAATLSSHCDKKKVAKKFAAQLKSCVL